MMGLKIISSFLFMSCLVRIYNGAMLQFEDNTAEQHERKFLFQILTYIKNSFQNQRFFQIKDFEKLSDNVITTGKQISINQIFDLMNDITNILSNKDFVNSIYSETLENINADELISYLNKLMITAKIDKNAEHLQYRDKLNNLLFKKGDDNNKYKKKMDEKFDTENIKTFQNSHESNNLTFINSSDIESKSNFYGNDENGIPEENEKPVKEIRFSLLPRTVIRTDNGSGYFLAEDSNESILETEHSDLLSRAVRDSYCHIHRDLKHSSLDCSYIHHRVECEQKCIWGHKFPSGRHHRTISCSRHTGGDWRVNDRLSMTNRNKDCIPFVHCSLCLRKAGELTCYSNYVDKETNCEIQCDNDHSKGHYTCSLRGHWSPRLPSCVKRGGGGYWDGDIHDLEVTDGDSSEETPSDDDTTPATKKPAPPKKSWFRRFLDKLKKFFEKFKSMFG